MKQTKKANQLRLVRNVVRELSSSDLGNVGGGCGATAIQRSGGCVQPSCYLNTGTPPIACGSASN